MKIGLTNPEKLDLVELLEDGIEKLDGLVLDHAPNRETNVRKLGRLQSIMEKVTS